jgi:predicted dehydrogenase
VADLRVGLVGFGLAGRAFHAPLIEAVAGLELAMVVTSRTAEVQSAYPGVRTAPSLDSVWDDIDLLVVAAPNRVHVSLASEAVRRGIPVVVDKPLAPTADEAARLVSEAAAAGVGLTVFHNRRWDGDFLTVRKLVADGELGDVIRLESRFERFRPQVAREAWREQGDPAEGGGALLDLGPHLVDQALVLFGPVSHVYGEVSRLRSGAVVDDDVFLALRHASGVRSHLSMGAVSPLHGPRFAVTGLAAGFASDGLDPQEGQLRDGVRPGDPGFGRFDRPGRIVDDSGERPVELEPGNYPAFYEGVVAWLRDGAPPPVDPVDAVEGLRLLEQAKYGSSTVARQGGAA